MAALSSADALRLNTMRIVIPGGADKSAVFSPAIFNCPAMT